MKEPKLRFSEFSDSLKQRNLSDITSKIGSGKTPHGGRKTYVSSGIPLIRSQNVNNDKVNFDDVVFIDKATDESMKNSRVMTNDVLLNITGASIGRSAVYKNEANANVNQHVCIIRLIKEYNPSFLQLCLASNYGQKQIDYSQAGGGREGLNFQAIGEMNFMFPSIEEQQKIALLFSELDNLIQSTEKELDDYRELKKGMLQKMFPKKGEKVPEIRFPEFTGDWEQRKFGDVVQIRRGLTYKPSDVQETGIRVLRSSNINEDTFVYNNDDVFVNPEAVNIDTVKQNDILITSANGSSRLVGKHTLVKEIPDDSAVHGGFMLLGRTKNYDFINASMSSSWYIRFINIYVTGGNGAIGNLSKSDLDEQLILVPSDLEQKKIGDYFSNLDSLIALQQKELDGYKELKKGLLQQMFC